MHFNDAQFKRCISYYGVDSETDFDPDASNTLFQHCRFDNVNLDNIDLSGAKFYKCEFINLKVDGIVGSPNCEFVECVFDHCDIKFLEFLQACFRNCSFIYTNKRKK